MSALVSRPDPLTPNGPLHLVVLHHGLWGDPIHMEPPARCISARRIHLTQKPDADGGGDSADEKAVPNMQELSTDKIAGDIVFLNISTSTGTLGYDGIDICGDRCARVVLERLEELGSQVDRISLIGYSLGGIVMRYVAGKLLAAGVFDRIRPLNFVSIASPHLGTSRPETESFFNRAMNGIQSAALVRLGAQFTVTDNFRDGIPLLIVLADPASIFYRALSKFTRRIALANIRNDFSVKFTTSAIEPTNQFRRLRAVYVDLERYPHIVIPSPSGEPIQLEPWTTQQMGYTAAAALLSPILLPIWFVVASTFLTSSAVSAKNRVSELVYDTEWINQPQSTSPSSEPDDAVPPSKDVAKMDPAQQRQWMVRTLNLIKWHKVYVSIPFTNAHAAIVMRRPSTANEHKSAMEYLANEVFLYE